MLSPLLVLIFFIFSYNILGDVMFNLIARYMERLKKEDVLNFAIKNNVSLSEEELDFTYLFVKKNWDKILRNPNLLNFDRFKDRYSEENFIKIQKLYQMYYQKYGHYL